MKSINYDQLKSWQEGGKDFHLVDVREIWEHEMFNIGGKLVPLSDVMTNKESFNVTDKPVVVYCKRGIRSTIAIQRLSSVLENVDFYNLENGIYHLST